MSKRTFPALALAVLGLAAAELSIAVKALRGGPASATSARGACEQREAKLTLAGATRLAFADLAAFEEVRRDLLERLAGRGGARGDPENYLYFRFTLAEGVQQIWVVPSVCRLHERGVDRRYWLREDRRIIDVEEGP